MGKRLPISWLKIGRFDCTIVDNKAKLRFVSFHWNVTIIYLKMVFFFSASMIASVDLLLCDIFKY